MQIIRDWFRRHLNHPQVVGLALVLLAGTAVVLFLGDVLAPVIAALVIAYLLEGLVRKLEATGLSRLWAVLVVFMLFMAVLLPTIFSLVPLLARQVAQLIEQMPVIIAEGRTALEQLVEAYPALFPDGDGTEADTAEKLRVVIAAIERELRDMGLRLLSLLSLESVVTLVSLLVYVILVPILVFFFLKDKSLLLAWLSRYLPRDRNLARTVWRDADRQIGNYIRGKVMEIVIVWAVTFVTFFILELKFAMLLALLVGLSVIVPYVGATVVALPVAVIAYFQFGMGSEFLTVIVAYLIIQALDGNVLVPVLFSEVVDLHPVAIIVAILVFGGLWGFWGVFFAIPLATLVQAVLKAWPQIPPQTGAPEAEELDAATEAESHEPR